MRKERRKITIRHSYKPDRGAPEEITYGETSRIVYTRDDGSEYVIIDGSRKPLVGGVVETFFWAL